MVIRTTMIGSHTSQGIIEMLFSLLPELLIVAIFGIVLAYNYKKIRLSVFDIALAVFFLSNVILGIYLGKDLIIAAFGFRLTYLPMIAYFAIRFNRNNSTSSFSMKWIMDKLSQWYVWAAVISLLLYFVFSSFEQDLMAQAAAKNSYYYIRRMGGLFLSPVVWGTFCAIIALYLYIKYAQSKKTYDLLGFLAMWFCLILSVSRGAIIPFYIGIIALTFLYEWYRPFVIILISSTLVFVCFNFYEPLAFNLIGFVSSSSIETIDRISSDEAQNVIANEDTADVRGINNTRAKFWALSIRSFSKKPAGYGLGKSGHVANKYKSILKDAKTASIYSTDGWYLKLINETGIWGGLSYLSITIMIIISVFRNFKRLHNNVFFVYCFIVFTLVAIQNFMSNVLDFYSFPVFYWMLIGFLQNFIEEKHD